MKRLLACLVALMIFLAGCVAPAADNTTAPTTIPTNPTTQPTDPTNPTDPTDPTDPADPFEPWEPTVNCSGHESDPYENVDTEAFYSNYTVACCYADACYRTEHHLMSGYLEVPGQYAEISEYQPTDSYGQLIRNTDSFYMDDGNTYVVLNAYGAEVLRVYKGAAYITLEEVAAYMFAFGGSSQDLPANYTAKKVKYVGTDPWGIYLRGNHSAFSGDTSKYPYEPALPRITGCGGDMQYYEIDIGTTGTDTGNGYAVKPYNDGNKIERGAARIVYTRIDRNRNGTFETDEVYLFYTCNHYNDFREYLNYYGGWGEIFGNQTGGGTLSDKYNCNPTDYVRTGYASFYELSKKKN